MYIKHNGQLGAAVTTRTPARLFQCVCCRSSYEGLAVQRFELGVAYRGSGAPEMKRFMEANSMGEAMREITRQFGGDEVAFVTYAHYCPPPEAQPPEPAASLIISAA